jgi:hypothetical protein
MVGRYEGDTPAAYPYRHGRDKPGGPVREIPRASPGHDGAVGACGTTDPLFKRVHPGYFPATPLRFFLSVPGVSSGGIPAFEGDGLVRWPGAAA